jgi:topoisomerase-4 subunit A
MDEAINHIDTRLEPWKPKLKREVTREDILKLMEIRMARILKFNTDKANDHLLAIEAEIEEINNKIENIIPFTIEWFERLKAKYGKGRERRTEIRNFENIVAAKVVIANEKLYVDRVEGFMGTSLKKAEYVSDCSDIDDVIVFRKDGTYLVTKVSEKAFIGKNILHLAIFKKNDNRTIYNVVYRDGKNGFIYMKRMAVTGVTRDKEYDLTQGTPGSRVLYFSENPNGEAEVLRVTLKPKPRIKKLIFEVDFSELAIKGRASMGNILTKFEIHKIALKEKGVSTLGGRKIWFDEDVSRLNSDNRGKYLGEFSGDDLILVIYKSGEYLLCNFDLSNHFDDGILLIEKFNPQKVLTAVYFDGEQGFYYVKRFEIEDVQNRKVGFIGEFPENRLVSFSWVGHPRLELQFGGKNEGREPEVVDVDEFIGVKSYKAKGKRLSIYEISQINELEPTIVDEVEEEVPVEEKKNEIVIPDIEDLLFGTNKPGDTEEPPNQMTLEF